MRDEVHFYIYAYILMTREQSLWKSWMNKYCLVEHPTICVIQKHCMFVSNTLLHSKVIFKWDQRFQTPLFATQRFHFEKCLLQTYNFTFHCPIHVAVSCLKYKQCMNINTLSL